MKTDFTTIEQLLDQVREFQLIGNHSDALSILDIKREKIGANLNIDFQILRSISYTALTQFKNAIHCLIPALSYSIESDNEKCTLECFFHIAEILYLQNNFQEAQDLLKNLLQFYKNSSQKNILARFTCLLGETIRIWNSGKPDIIEREALPLTREAIRMFSLLGDKAGIAEGLSNLGLIFMNLGSYGKTGCYRRADRCFKKSLEFFKEIGDHTKAAWQEYNIGALLAQTGDGKRGSAYILKTADYMQRTGNTLGLAWHYYSLAHINADLLAQRDPISLNYYLKALDLFDKIRDEIAGNIALNEAFFEEVSDAYQRFASIIAGNSSNVSQFSFDLLFNMVERAKANMLLRQITWKHSQPGLSTPSSFQKFVQKSKIPESITKVIESIFFNAFEESNGNKNPDRISLDIFQKQVLREDEVFVSFYCAVRTILCLIVTPNGYRLERIEDWKGCWESIIKLKNCACDRIKCFTEYDLAAEVLGEIFYDVIQTISRSGKKVIISPDVQISNIPFDSLPFKGLYPLLGSEVSYVHSASILAKLRSTHKINPQIPFKMYVDYGAKKDIVEAKRMCRNQFGSLCNMVSSCDNMKDCRNLMHGNGLSDIRSFLVDSAECLHKCVFRDRAKPSRPGNS